MATLKTKQPRKTKPLPEPKDPASEEPVKKDSAAHRSPVKRLRCSISRLFRGLMDLMVDGLDPWIKK